MSNNSNSKQKLSQSHSFGQLFVPHLKQRSLKTALVDSGVSISYSELDDIVAKIIHGFRLLKWAPKDKVVILFPPRPELYALLVALFSQNITAVFIDIGMNVKSIVRCIVDADPIAIISIPKFAFLKVSHASLWKIPLYVLGKRVPFVSRSYSRIFESVPVDYDVVSCSLDDSCIITYTSGSTSGKNKAANRTHGVLKEQVDTIVNLSYALDTDDVIMTTMPIAALLALTGHLTACIPEVDLRFQKHADVNVICRQIHDHNIQGLAVSPAFIYALTQAGHRAEFLKVKTIKIGGAPISKKVMQRVQRYFPNAHVAIVYGSTEAEPVSCINMDDFLSREDNGMNVGKIEDVIQYAIIPQEVIPDLSEAIPTLNITSNALPQGEVGELVISAKHVLENYLDDESMRSQKVIDSVSGAMWHRMGDLGYINTHSELVLLSRISHVIHYNHQTIYPFSIEMKVNNLETIYQSAVIMPKEATRPTIIIELEEGGSENTELLSQIKDIVRTQGHEDFPVLVIPSIPTDMRHDSRVDRKKLENIYSKLAKPLAKGASKNDMWVK